MLKRILGVLLLSLISISAFADDGFTFDAKIQYQAACPIKDDVKCVHENK